MNAPPPEPTVTIPRRQVYELLAHLVASADLCAVEPSYYGTFRLLDAASKLAGVAVGSGLEDEWLADLRSDIEQNKTLMMSDRAAYYEYLPQVTKRVAQHLMETAAADDTTATP